jgi:hypothetical protein
MQFPNIDQLRFLFEKREQFCVSLFLPTHRAGPDTRQDPIRLKNLLKEAESRLITLGRKPVKVRQMLAPARGLVSRGGFWRQQQDGMAVFLSNGLLHQLRLPLSFPELVSVAESFEISPILPLFTAGGHFYVLALSRNHVRLFRGTSTTFDELETPGIPHSVDEALKYDVRESQLQVHSGAGGSAAGKEAAVFTGQGIGVDDEQIRTHEFLLMVEKGVRGQLREERVPLVLAGVAELLAVYRGLNKYPVLLDHGVTGNPDRLKSHELHAAAWDVARSHFEAGLQQALARYREFLGTTRTTNNLSNVLTAAFNGRIDSVFLPTGIQLWGKFKSEDNYLERRAKQEAGDDDLLNLIATQTILHRGTAYMIAPQSVPDNSEVVAILRY